MIAILLLFGIGILWILSDTITEFLSGGKSFACNELKVFR